MASDQPGMKTSPATEPGNREKIREILRLELECAADASLQKGNLTAARILRKLAETTRHVEVRALYAYAQLLDDITASPTSSDELRKIGGDWLPATATEYVERLVSVRRDGGRASGKPQPR